MNQNFKKLQTTWYNKLRKSGFVDCEDEYQRLIEYHSSKYSSRDPLAFASQQRYYELAAQLLHSHSFRNIEEKTIWRLHSQGKTIANIAKKINRSQHYVNECINDLAGKLVTNE